MDHSTVLPCEWPPLNEEAHDERVFITLRKGVGLA
jgi:hypothetical protein